MDQFFRRAAWETIKTALFIVIYCLFAMSLFAVFIKAYAPSDTVITAVNWVLKCVGTFVLCLFFIKRERAFFKGIAAGLAGAVLTMLAFAAIGGGFHLSVLFLPELLLCALAGGAGALLGAKLRKA